MSLPASGAKPAPMLREEWFLGLSLATSVIFLAFGKPLMDKLSNPVWATLIFVWIFVAILGSVFAVVRHADHLAIRLGEPYGTLILTLAVTSIEVVSISTIMFHEGTNSTLVRDTLFAVVMIILNGMVGLSLLVGGWRHREQSYNLQGANAYLSVIIPLAVLSLILPNYTQTTPGPTLSFMQETFLALMFIGLYGAFLAIQTTRHRRFFTLGEGEGEHATPGSSSRSLGAHIALLAAYMASVDFLAERLAQPLDGLIKATRAPVALGGVIIAALVATPECVGAVRAALANQMQRSANIFLGSVLATIGLTVPTMLVISHVTGRRLILGVEHGELVLLPLTLAVSMITFGSGRTNVLQGIVHLLLFAAYVMLIFAG